MPLERIPYLPIFHLDLRHRLFRGITLLPQGVLCLLRWAPCWSKLVIPEFQPNRSFALCLKASSFTDRS